MVAASVCLAATLFNDACKEFKFDCNPAILITDAPAEAEAGVAILTFADLNEGSTFAIYGSVLLTKSKGVIFFDIVFVGKGFVK